ncbi:hypothetical protein ADUPG1_000880 [Aduncisulcus paluster]|uniref:HORMA domain-containing protein n=1 Tax=Aduncisulcus paluster TaxID=2918883 RepID=A0ABQ5KA68_9EUKA|nr:hypothetical protein ADUPG1_000880 [Aduncisulcus paluster]
MKQAMKSSLRSKVVNSTSGIFPEDAFKEVNIGGAKIKTLKAVSDDTHQMIKYLEKGIFPEDAFKEVNIGGAKIKTLKAVSDDTHQMIKYLEKAYTMTITYSDDDIPKIDVVVNSKSAKSGKRRSSRSSPALAEFSRSSVKGETVSLLRTLISIMDGLPPILTERHIQLRLSYTDDTPDDYEPPFFQPVPTKIAKMHFQTPQTMTQISSDTAGKQELSEEEVVVNTFLGKVSTPHHAVNVCLITADDAISLDDREGMSGSLDESEKFPIGKDRE